MCPFRVSSCLFVDHKEASAAARAAPIQKFASSTAVAAIAILNELYNGVAPSGGWLARAPAKAATPVHGSGRIAILLDAITRRQMSVSEASTIVARLAVMGLIAGAPAIAGAWIGGLAASRPLAALFLAIGAGAMFEVVDEIGTLLRQDTAKRPMPLPIFAGVAAGMQLLYVTGMLIK